MDIPRTNRGDAAGASRIDCSRAGEEYLLVESGKTLEAAANEAAKGLDVRLSWAAARIYRDSEGVTVRRDDGVMLRGRACVVALPLGVLKAGDVALAPALPPRIAKAVAELPVANAVKVAAALTKAIWPDGWWNAVCGDALFPEVWRSSEQGGVHVVVGFATGSRADAVAALGAREHQSRTCPTLRPSRRRRRHANAAKTIERGLRLSELGSSSRRT